MCWSLYGRRGSSDAMMPLIFSLTDSADTPSPSLERMLEVKKYLSSRVPCGVCTYLLAVARLTVDSNKPMSFATSFSTKGRSALTPWSRNSRGGRAGGGGAGGGGRGRGGGGRGGH